MLKVIIKVFRRSCKKHRRFNPAIDGRGAIRGGCEACQLLMEVYEQSQALERLMERAAGKTQQTKRKKKPAAAPIDERQEALFEPAELEARTA